MLIGWSNYFRHAQVYAIFERLDKWIRPRFRCAQMCKGGVEKPRTREAKLLGAGLSSERARASAYNGRGLGGTVERRAVAHECNAPDTLFL